KRSSNLMYVVPRSMVVAEKEEDEDADKDDDEEDREKEKVEVSQEVKDILDEVTRKFMYQFSGDDIKATAVMTVFALPRDSDAFEQAYHSLHNLRQLNSQPTVTEQGSTIFYTTFAEVVASVNNKTAESYQRKLKETKLDEKDNPFAARFVRPVARSERQTTLQRIARDMGRSKDLEARPIDIYISYLEWAKSQGFTDTIVQPQDVLDVYNLSVSELLRLQQAADTFGVVVVNKEVSELIRHLPAIIESKHSHVFKVVEFMENFIAGNFEALYETFGPTKVDKKEYFRLLGQLHKVYQALSDEDREVLRVAAVFHDIGSRRGERNWIHSEIGSRIVKDILRKLGHKEDFIAKVSKVILYHPLFANLGVDYLPKDLQELSKEEKDILLLMMLSDASGRAQGNTLTPWKIKRLIDLRRGDFNHTDFYKLRFGARLSPLTLQDNEADIDTSDSSVVLTALGKVSEEFKENWRKLIRVHVFALLTGVLEADLDSFIKLINLINSRVDENKDENKEEIENVIVDTNIDFMGISNNDQRQKYIEEVIQKLETGQDFIKVTREGKTLRIILELSQTKNAQVGLNGFRPSRIVNIVGQVHAGKSSTLHRLDKYFRTYMGKNAEFEAVDVGDIYRAYAYSILQLQAQYGDYVLESEENILYYLSKARVDSVNGEIYLNGKWLSQDVLHDQNQKVVENIDKIVKDNPRVIDFLQQQDRRIVSGVAANSNKWVVVAGRGFYPQAWINIFLSADTLERAKDAIKENPDISMTHDEAIAYVEKRDRQDKVNENLLDYPGVFKVIDTTENHSNRDAIAKKILDFVKKESIRQQKLSEQRAAVFDRIVKKQQENNPGEGMTIVLRGGVRGGLEADIERAITDRVNADFTVEADLHKGLTAQDAVMIWGDVLRKMVDDLEEDNVAQTVIKEGLRYLAENNGWEFKRWSEQVAVANKKSKKAQALALATKHLRGNIRILKLGKYKGKEPFDSEKFQEKLQNIVIRELSFPGNITSGQILWELWFASLKDDLDTGKLGFVVAEAKQAGLSQEDIKGFAAGVELTTQERLVRVVSTLDEEEVQALETGEVDRDLNERLRLRGEVIPTGNQAAVRRLYEQVNSLGVDSRDG
ncbi:MAG: (d)CMP kinase, partial [Omnitrophica bacterium]|nr:(d)CMP kinase [Candidatus Omnitrophota bacterium]